MKSRKVREVGCVIGVKVLLATDLALLGLAFVLYSDLGVLHKVRAFRV